MAWAGTLDIQVTNAISGAPLSALQVHAMEEGAEGNLIWRAAGSSDGSGHLSLSLAGLGQGTRYVLMSNPYNGGFAFSTSITSEGSFNYEIGALEVTALSGVDGSMLINHRVGAVELLTDGTSKWAAEGTTDAQGVVRLDLPGLGNGRRYSLYSFRPADDSYFGGKELLAVGQHEFRVGHPLLKAHVIDHLDGLPLNDLDVYLVRLNAAGDPELVASGITDGTGHVQFEHIEFGSDTIFQLAIEAFNGITTFSEDITVAGDMTFRMGKLRVAVVSGGDGTPLPNYSVGAMERLSDGSDVLVAQGTTDSAGNIRFDLEGLGEGRNYVIYTQSPVDDTIKKSALITTNGVTVFPVGSEPLNVTLTDQFSGEALAGKLVFVFIVSEDGSKEGIALGTTDEYGKVSFDIDPLSEGKTIQLMSQPYNGGWTLSDPVTVVGETPFVVGQLPVRLRDIDLGVDLPGQTLTLLQRLEEGGIIAVATGTTDESGRVIFDAQGLDTGSIYSVSAQNIFGFEKQYFSPWIEGIGAIDFSVSRDGEFNYDITGPELAVLAPSADDIVSAGGFLIHGTVSDNLTLGELFIEIQDENLGTTIIPIVINDGQWSQVVPSEALSPSSNLSVTVHASDRIGNETEVAVSLNSVLDKLPPSLVVQSHNDQDTVSAAGFLLTGSAADNVNLQHVTATVVDSGAGQLMHERELEVASNSGTWAVVVDGLTAGAEVQVQVSARDFDGHETSAVLSLDIVAPAATIGHAINRLTFGATPELLQQTRGLDAATFIDQQLDPASIDESALELMLTERGEPMTTGQLQDYQTIRALHAQRQLLEKMTWFWENHFNTYLGKSGSVELEFRENNLFRTHALGRFRDLLQVSATSPAMLIYLDNYNNYFNGPNENYARELMEMHTLGVDGGYTEADVDNMARVFTGWSVEDNEFSYFDFVHDTGAKSVLGLSLVGNEGQDEGRQVLDLLATHPSTASNLCKKLQVFLVTDTPAPQDIASCANVFLSTDGDIGAVVASILHSPAFSATGQFNSKIKTPLEFMAGLARGMAQEMSNEHLRAFLWMLGMPSFYCMPPTGWSELGADWVNSTQLWTRTVASISTLFNADMAMGMFLEDSAAWFIDRGYETEEAVLGYLVELAGGEAFSGVVWDEARSVLRGATSSFDINDDAEDVGSRLKAAAAVMLSAPQYHLQ
jgi:uncharacterized protein (DUF1800 family)/5-hydroxyisourate hydrolase-like protein (transthyretin family)